MRHAKNLCLLSLLLLAGMYPVMAGNYLEVGYAEADVTPEIAEWIDADGDGKHTPGDGSPYDTGEKVTRFKDGPIYIGNGNGEAWYVHDRIYARVVVLCDPESGKKVALVSLDLYMLQKPECDFIRDLAAGMNFTHIAVHATHNHMGPDTLGRNGPNLTNGINGRWLRKMQYATAGAIREAYQNRVSANLRFLCTKTRYGLNDTRDPSIYDDDLVAMQAVSAGKVLVTLVQWANHVEATMAIDKGNGAPPEMKEKVGHIITAGFPGHVARHAGQVFGGHGIYFNGAVGGLMTMLHTFVWEPFKPYSPDTPLAEIPPDYPGKVHDNFQMAEWIGNELVDKLHREHLEQRSFADGLRVDARSREFKLPLHNELFIAGFVAGIIGFDKRKVEGSIWDRPFIFSEVSWIDIGPAQIVCLPGELFPEVSCGLPDDFYTNNARYYRHPEWHKTGKDFTIPKPVKQRMGGEYRFVFGLTNDALGYLVNPYDYKLHEYMPWFQKADGHYEETQSATERIVPLLLDALDSIMADNQ